MRRRDRRAGRPPVAVRRGDRVIDARVQARLLGLHLLDIDAQVIVATARDGTTEHEPVTAATGRAGRSRDGRLPPDGSTPELARAVRLLAEGSNALDDARRLR
jgi:hypothetical protein